MPTRDSDTSDEETGAPADAPIGEASPEAFAHQITQELQQTESEIRKLSNKSDEERFDESLRRARELVQEFRPVPQFIWRIVNYAIGRPGRVNKLSDGSLFGLKKLILNIGKDRILGKGSNVMTTRAVLELVGSDVIAATAMIHAISRRLQSKEFQAIWGPILDDALVRAQTGYFVGTMCESFGPGRGMLAAFAGRVGLAVLIASGNADQAQAAITLLANGREIEGVALGIYGCEPIHVAALMLSAAGCGRDAVLGITSFTLPQQQQALLNPEQTRWLSALMITENVRAGTTENIPEEIWSLMGYDVTDERQELNEIITTLKRRGHGWNWMI